jgi:hypothetical protein
MEGGRDVGREGGKERVGSQRERQGGGEKAWGKGRVRRRPVSSRFWG